MLLTRPEEKKKQNKTREANTREIYMSHRTPKCKIHNITESKQDSHTGKRKAEEKNMDKTHRPIAHLQSIMSSALRNQGEWKL